MRLWAYALAATATLPVQAYVKNYASPSTPSKTLQLLDRRADTCPSGRPVSCSTVDSKLPGNFCCGDNTTCQSVDRSSSAICCPKGKDCTVISRVDCNIDFQNPVGGGAFLSTRTLDKLPACGDKCCPFGYVCSTSGSDTVCQLDKTSAGPATTTKVTSTTSVTATNTPTAAAVGIDSNDPPPTKESNVFPVGIFFAGFFPGLLVGILATLAWVVLTKRHNKAPDTRGLATNGYAGSRPFISMPMKDSRHSNERSDFLAGPRSRIKSVFGSGRPVSSTKSFGDHYWAHKMPTPPADSNVPPNYVNDMPDVPVTPARRVAKYESDEFVRAAPNEQSGFSPVSPDSVRDPDRSTIRIYSPEFSQHKQADVPIVPVMPSAAVAPLRGMNTQRRISPPQAGLDASLHRRDSGTGMDAFGSPFQTPEKKPQISSNTARSVYGTYDNVETNQQTLTPARYDPKPQLAPSAAALAAAKRLDPHEHPVVPPRPQGKPTKRPQTQMSDFDFDEGLEHEPPSPEDTQSPPREAYKSQAVGNPYMQRANPASTFDTFLPTENDVMGTKDKHATNATTFTTMLKAAGFPDTQSQMPAVPKIDVAKLQQNNEKRPGKGKKGMI